MVNVFIFVVSFFVFFLIKVLFFLPNVVIIKVIFIPGGKLWLLTTKIR